MIKPLPAWVSSYEKKFEDVYKKLQGKSDFKASDGESATKQAWQSWVNENGEGISCIPPLPPFLPSLITISGTTSAANFGPLETLKTAVSGPQTAQILATAWQSWATSILWTPVTPAPPFSAVLTVTTSPASVSAAYATLLSGLIAEFATPPASGGEKAKFQAMGRLFSTATMSLQVMFNGLGIGVPPPPLIVMVPVL